MTKDEILKQSTPRPWEPDADGRLPYDRFHNGKYYADCQFVKLAVNSYEAHQALIKQLVEALEAVKAQTGTSTEAWHTADAALAAAKEHTK